MRSAKPVNQAPQWLQDKSFTNKSADTLNSQAVSVYTILTILMRMKSDFGFEAMLEYMEKYLRTVETQNPEIKTALRKALDVISLHRLYKEVEGHG